MRACAVLLVGLLGGAGVSRAEVIGPWPVVSSLMWEDQPIVPTCGTVTINPLPEPFGTLTMSGFTSGSKSTWLPYGGTYAERMCLAGLVFEGSAPLATAHARVYDPATSGKSGWALILKDGEGRILDFGIRSFFATQQMRARQYDGASWTEGPALTRTRTGNNYYGIDFAKNPDGTVGWVVTAYENGAEWTGTGQTTIGYAALTEVYLNVMTPDTTGGANYRWTEFDYTTLQPRLTFLRSSVDLYLSWPAAAGAFVVESATRLGPSDWSEMDPQPPIQRDDDVYTAIIPFGSGNRFFRLRQ